MDVIGLFVKFIELDGHQVLGYYCIDPIGKSSVLLLNGVRDKCIPNSFMKPPNAGLGKFANKAKSQMTFDAAHLIYQESYPLLALFVLGVSFLTCT